MMEDENGNFTRKSAALCPFVFTVAIFLTAAVVITAAALAAFGASDENKKAAVKSVGICLESEKGQASSPQGERLFILRFLLGKEEKAENLSYDERIDYLCENIIVIKERKYEDGILSREYSYDKVGNMMEDICYRDNGSISSWVKYEYDTRGNRTKYIEIQYGSTGEWKKHWEYRYDKDNNITELIFYIGFDDVISARHEYEYNKAGNLIKEAEWEYDEDGSMRRVYDGIYDEDGKITQKIFYNDEGSVSSWIVYEYEDYESGSRMRVVKYDDSSIGFWQEYEYDKEGNEIRVVDYDEDGSINFWEEYEYDGNSNKIKETVYISYDSNGNSSYQWTEYEYDKENRQIKETTYDEEESRGTRFTQQEWLYDELGNLLKVVYRDGNDLDDLSIWREDKYRYNIFGNVVESRWLGRCYTHEYIYTL